MRLNQFVQDYEPYVVVSQKAWQEPDGVLKLDWNEATVSPSPKVSKACTGRFRLAALIGTQT